MGQGDTTCQESVEELLAVLQKTRLLPDVAASPACGAPDLFVRVLPSQPPSPPFSPALASGQKDWA